MTTAQDIVVQALQANGVAVEGQTPSAASLASGLKWLQLILAGWQRRRWMVWHLVDTPMMASGKLSYTVGPGGDFAIMRPDKIEGAYARLITNGAAFTIAESDIGGMAGIGGPAMTPGVLNVDYPIYLIDSYEEYARISLKTLQTFPSAVFYDAAFPTGNLYFWPIPNSSFELHILTKEALQQFAGLTDNYNMPPEYEEALVWSCAARMRPSYGLQPDPTINAAVQVALQTIRMANAQIPTLEMPEGLPMSNRQGWWWSVGGSAQGSFTLDSSTLG